MALQGGQLEMVCYNRNPDCALSCFVTSQISSIFTSWEWRWCYNLFWLYL